ncbi:MULTISPECIES: hypothetical protein [unclassified Methanosarcina]|uniref:hypothetical protein n=1 Tax=unclassified Methanosarcina TaxID=2644672 RepID=UPI0025EA6AD8|nr:MULTISPECIES: hypothetical protein [unclassified Methanosarcina]
MTIWEYDVKEIRFSEWSKAKEDLNSLGTEGWELIKFADDIDENGMIAAVFKRSVDYVDASL